MERLRESTRFWGIRTGSEPRVAPSISLPCGQRPERRPRFTAPAWNSPAANALSGAALQPRQHGTHLRPKSKGVDGLASTPFNFALPSLRSGFAPFRAAPLWGRGRWH